MNMGKKDEMTVSKTSLIKNEVMDSFSHIVTIINYFQHNTITKQSIDNLTQIIPLSTLQTRNLFIDWAGVSLEEFFEFIDVHYAKQLLNPSQPTLFEDISVRQHLNHAVSHDTLVEITEMKLSEIGEKLIINYSFSETIFGTVLVASTPKGICYTGFSDDDQTAFSELTGRFPKAKFVSQIDANQQGVLRLFTFDWHQLDKVKLHLSGTNFQLKVWCALLKIPLGSLTTYGNVATTIQQPKAARAVGTAIGSNPVAFLIPCHRVIQKSGIFGGFMWGASRKAAIIGWEQAKINVKN